MRRPESIRGSEPVFRGLRDLLREDAGEILFPYPVYFGVDGGYSVLPRRPLPPCRALCPPLDGFGADADATRYERTGRRGRGTPLPVEREPPRTVQRHRRREPIPPCVPPRVPLDLPIRFPVAPCHGFPTFPARADVVYLDTSYRSNRLWFRPVKSDRFFYVSVSHLTTSNSRQASKPIAFFRVQVF